MQISVSLLCPKCWGAYPVDDAGLLYFTYEPGESVEATAHPCPSCGNTNVILASLRTESPLDQTVEEWPDVVG
jgi:ribosomal protein S27AE